MVGPSGSSSREHIPLPMDFDDRVMDRSPMLSSVPTVVSLKCFNLSISVIKWTELTTKTVETPTSIFILVKIVFEALFHHQL